MKPLRQLNAELADANGNADAAWAEHDRVVEIWLDSDGLTVTHADMNAAAARAVEADRLASLIYQEREDWYAANHVPDPLDFDDDDAGEDEDATNLRLDQEIIAHGNY